MTAEELRKLLTYDPETGVFTWLSREGNARLVKTWNTRYAGKAAGAPGARGYISIKVNDRLYRAHRLAWLFVHSQWPSDQIDHINGDRTDNRIGNLREATNAQNIRNSRVRRDNASGFRGVTWHRGDRRWRANINVDGKHIFLGCFREKEDAARAYAAAAEKHFGEFRRESRR